MKKSVLTFAELRFKSGYFKIVGSRTGKETSLIDFIIEKPSMLAESNIQVALDDRLVPMSGFAWREDDPLLNWEQYFFEQVDEKDVREFLRLHKKIVGY